MVRVAKPKAKLGRTYFREWREFCNLSQEAAADRLDISRTMLSKIENGKQQYNQTLLELAAKAYGTDPASILMRNPLAKDAPWSIGNKLRGVPQERLDMIEGVIDAMLKAG
jgi:transcriptional regulator with XRE-family HTH domain